MSGAFTPLHWIIVIAVALLLFGGRGKISGIMGDFAKGIKAFKAGMKEENETAATPHQQVPPPAGTAPAAATGNSAAYSGSRDQHV
jgi:sec-independent protein translocase protein TatA